MAATKKRRGRRHPGVTLIPPDEKTRSWWRARFIDPDTDKSQKVTLERSLTTAELRGDWAVRKSKALAKRRLELEGGAPKATGTALDTALDRYFRDHPQLREGTRGIYKQTSDKFADWARRNRIKSADDLTGAHLVAFRAVLLKEPLRSAVPGGRRGERGDTEERRAPTTINRELRSIGTVLRYLRRLGLLPKISADDITDALGKLAVPSEQITYLRPRDCQRLLEAALRHDADTYKATRREHAGSAPPGSTNKHPAIAPFVAFVLLTGTRVSEARTLEWSQVDLDALDNDGNTVGEIYLSSSTKTGKSRTIGLEVSPSLRRLLAALKLRRGESQFVFGFTRDATRSAAERLKRDYGAPAGFGWQVLRSTCGCYLTNAPAIFGGASAYRSAKQLGHDVQVAERHYVDVVRGISKDAKTLEAAMQIDEQLQSVIGAVSVRQDNIRRLG